MTLHDRQRRIVAAVEEFHRRRVLERAPDPETFRESLGADYDDFLALIGTLGGGDPPKPAPAEPPLPRPFGPYVLERVLGVGGMGTVYEALHRDLVRRVALKVCPKALDLDPMAVERFRREARACAQVRHPNVVTVYEAGEVDGQLYYAMELIDGETLQQRIDAGRAPAGPELALGLADVADALHSLHAAGVMHRDVKPGNLLVRPDGRIVLADFGLARTLVGPSLTQTGDALGTPPYMSPEQLIGHAREVDARTDVYGLCATIYHAIAGHPPFSPKRPEDLVRLVLLARPEPLHDVRPDVDRGLEAVVLKGLEKRKEDRYVTAGDLRDDLRAVAAGRRPVGGPVAPWKRALRGAKPFALPLAAALGLLLGAYLLWSGRSSSLFVRLPLAADLWVGNTLMGRVEKDRGLEVRLAPGEYAVQLKGKGFDTAVESLVLKPGATKSYRVSIGQLVVRDPDDPELLRAFGEFLKVDWAEWAALESTRSEVSELSPTLPRGNVRRADLDVAELRVAGIAAFADGPVQIAFQRDGVSLAPPIQVEADAAVEGRVVVPVPDAVRAALQPGDVLLWGVLPRGRRADARLDPRTSARARIVDTDVGDDLAALERQMAAQPEALRSLFRARLLRTRGLCTAAARTLRDAVPAPERSLHATLVLHDALRRAGVPPEHPDVGALSDVIAAAKDSPVVRTLLK